MLGDPSTKRYGPLVEPLVHRIRSDGSPNAADHLAGCAVAIDALARHPCHRRDIKRAGVFDVMISRLIRLLGRPSDQVPKRAVEAFASALARLWRCNLADKATFRAATRDEFCTLVQNSSDVKALRELHALVLSYSDPWTDFKPRFLPRLVPQLYPSEGLLTPYSTVYAQTARRLQLQINCSCLIEQFTAANATPRLSSTCPITVDDSHVLFRTSHCQLLLPLPHTIVPQRSLCRLTTGSLVLSVYKSKPGRWRLGLRQAEAEWESDDDEQDDGSDMASLRSLDRLLRFGARRRRRRPLIVRAPDESSDSDCGSDDSDAWDVEPDHGNPMEDGETHEINQSNQGYLNHVLHERVPWLQPVQHEFEEDHN